jgi:hypothetical protein
MKCRSCDCNLNDYESTIKSPVSGEYLDLCKNCLSYIPNVSYVDRPDLANYTDISQEINDETEV